MTVTHKINMDLDRRGVIPRIDAVQADRYSRAVELCLYSGGLEWAPPSDASILVRYSRPDGTSGNYDTLPSGDVAGTIEGNAVTITLAPQVLTVAGIAHVAVCLIDGTAEINTFYLEVRVQKNPAGSDLPVDTYIDTNSATATATDIASGKTAFVAGKKITGTHVCSGGIDTSDATATAADIKNGKTAFVAGKKITGTHTCEGGVDTSDATATAADIKSGKTAYVSGTKVTGTHECAGPGELVKASGTTESNVIDTGLSTIDFIAIYKAGVSAAGLVYAQFDGESSYCIYCISYSTTIKNFSIANNTYGSVDGGVFTWDGTGNAALTEGVTYNWIAYGSQ